MSEACTFCYAADWAKRTGNPELWKGERRRTKTWGDPVKWNAKARETGKFIVFCASLADVFEDDPRLDPWREDLWQTWVGESHDVLFPDWVICGGESGPKARPMHPDWARSMRDQCQDAGVAFHMKQLSQTDTGRFKDFDAFPPDLQVREYPPQIHEHAKRLGVSL